MIYLIESNDKLKIGYAKNAEQRFKTYRTHNIDAQLLAYKTGIRKDEKLLHELCKEYQYEGEWFYNNDFVKDTFNNYTTTIITDFPEVKKIITLFAKFIQEEAEVPKNYYEWEFAKSKYRRIYKDQFKFLDEYFNQLRYEENLDDSITNYWHYYNEQLRFWKSPKIYLPEEENFNIIDGFTLTISPKEEPRNPSISQWLNNNDVILEGFPLTYELREHLLDAECIIKEYNEEFASLRKQVDEIKELWENLQQIKQTKQGD